MAENAPRMPTPADMLNSWKQLAEQAEGQWNQYFNQMMGTEQFAELMGKYMEGYLAQQQTLAGNVEKYMQTMNLPTRSDFIALSERLASLETQVSLLVAEQRRAAKPSKSDDSTENANGRRRGAKASRE